MSPRTPEQFNSIREDKRELIKTTALKLFAVKGYYSTSVSEIAHQAGISKGLMYNYYLSKEDLLSSIFSEMINMVSLLINPDSDQEITDDEMVSFFDKFINSLSSKRDYWILFYQLSIQPDVFKFLVDKIESGQILINYNMLIYKYFAERFENPQEEMLFFTSVIKGFSTIYIFSPQTVGENLIPAFKERLIKLLIRNKKI